MNWFKRLFQNNDTKLQEGDHVFSGSVKEPTIETLNIGEPVLSFIECVRNNRRRFSFTNGNVFLRSHTITLTDRETGEQWCVRSYYNGGFDNYNRLEDKLDWLTNDEQEYLIKELSKIAKERAQQVADVKAIRKN